MGKDKKQKFTNKFVAALAAPNTLPENKKYETLRDSKSNIILRNYRTGGKIFYAYYWFRDQTIYYNLGKWEQNYFNVDDARKRAREVQSSFIDKGLDPRIEKKKEKIENYRLQILQTQKIHFRGLIEKYIEANMPRVKNIGTQTSKSAKQNCYYVIGSKRTAKVKFYDDDKGNGNIVRRDQNLRSWQDFWAKNQSQKTDCIYDSFLGITYLDDLNSRKIKRYINKFGSYRTKKNIKNATSTIITWGIDNEYFGEDKEVNPCSTIIVPKQEKEQTYRANKTYKPHEIKAIWEACDKLKEKYPFQTSAIKLLSVTSLRKEEALKLKWDSNINEKQQLIELDKGSVKIRANQDIDITNTINVVLHEIKELRKKYKWSFFLPWLFPSVRVRNKTLKDGKQPYFSKKNPHSTRLKDIRNCWRDVRVLAGLESYARLDTFKKTHHNIAKRVAPDPYDLIGLTRHTNTNVLEKNYLNTDLEKRKSNAEFLDMEFKKILQ